MKQRLLFIAYLLLSLSGNAKSANNWIRQMAQDGENLWLATNRGGLVKHNKQTGENTIYTTSNSGLCSDYLLSVACYGGKVLVGSDGDGVSEFDGSTFKTYNEENAPFEHSRQCFEEVIYDADGNMWLGGLYYIYKYDGTTWEDYTLPQAEWSSWLGFSVLKSSADGTLWFATEGPNFDGSVGYITKDKEIKIASPSTHNIYGMDIDKQGRVWYSCQTCGLYCYDGSNRRLFAKNESAYYGLCIDDDNNVWFGCDNLLYKYDGTAFTSYQVPTNGDVYDLLLDGNAIWVAVLTTGELFRFEDGQFESIDYTTNTEIEEENDDYRPFVEDGKVWTYHYYNDFTGKEFYESLTVSGDTVINNKSYKKIVDVATGRVYCALREEGGKVYANYPNYSGENLIYDFGLNVGDAFPLYEGSDPWATVVSVDTIVVGDRSFRALDVRPNDAKGWPNWWVEGIGGMYHLTSNSIMPGNFYSFSSCQLDGDTLFTSRDFQTLGTIPSPEKVIPMVEEGRTWNVVTINPADPTETEPANFYDILGRKGRVWNRISYVIDGDTVIGGVTYKKLLSNGNFVCGMREENGRVYGCGWSWAPSSEQLLYDFNAQPGDVFKSADGLGKIQVKHVREVDINGQSRRCLEMHHYDVDEEGKEYYGGFADYWIEGIGCTGYPHNPYWWEVIGNYPLLLSCYDGDKCIFNIEDFNSQTVKNLVDDIAYRPFVEDGKVWKVGYSDSGNPVKRIQYYYFDGDTIIDGRICKKMMCQQYVNPDYPGHDYSLYMGAWYEENQKIYWTKGEESEIMYDFSLAANAPLPPSHYVLGPRQTGGLDGFKGVYRDVIVPEEEGPNGHVTSWLEGVGDLNGPFVQFYNTYIVQQQPPFLMSCTVGDEVIYLNDEYEDGATPEGARKSRFDFTHTIKIKPKAPMMRSNDISSVYGEYNDLQLGINLNPLDEAYQVRITNESGQVVYEKAINAGSIVGLNIDISAYPEGRYTVTVENSQEAFTGEFEMRATGIEEAKNKKAEPRGNIYNLQGQRISSLQKGLNIMNGQKIYVK